MTRDVQRRTHREQLEAFAKEWFCVEPDMIREDPHIFAFLSYCTTRPVTYDRTGRTAERPFRRTLPDLVVSIESSYRASGQRCPITRRSHAFARRLCKRLCEAPRKAKPLLPRLMRKCAQALSAKYPWQRRLKAILLLLCDTWCRPSEVLRLRYPAGILAAYDKGIVLTISRSKTNQSGDPEFIPVAHTADASICPVCALKDWIDFLGWNHRGLLFPTFRPGYKIGCSVVATGSFTRSLKDTLRRVGCSPKGYSAYSTRRGAATGAVVANWPWDRIQRKLRHKHIFATFGYVDDDVLMQRARSALDPSR